MAATDSTICDRATSTPDSASMRCDFAALSAARLACMRALAASSCWREMKFWATSSVCASQLLLGQGELGFALQDQGRHGRYHLLPLAHQRSRRIPRRARLPLLGLGSAKLRLQRLRVHARDLVVGSNEVALAHTQALQAPARLGRHIERRGLKATVSPHNALWQTVGGCPAPSHDDADDDHGSDGIQ